jgi:hypothetical protein
MRPILLAAALSIYLSSCVSLRNQSYDGFYVRSKPNSQIVYDCQRYELLELDGDTTVGTISCGSYKLKGDDTRAYLLTTRSGERIPLTIKDDKTSRTVYIKPHLSGLYYSNIFNLGFGFKKDKDNPNRFTYPRKVYVDFRDTGNYYTYFKQPRKGNFQLILSPPIGNVWGFSFGKGIRGASPVVGTAMGLSYWYNNKHFVSLSAGTAVATSGFCPDGCTYIDSIPIRQTRQAGSYFSLQHHHLLGRFDIGYGVYLAKHKLELYDRYYKDDILVSSKTMTCFGPTVSTHFQIFTFLYGGFEYQPQFFTIDKTTPKGYQHILNIGVQFRFTPKRHSKW